MKYSELTENYSPDEDDFNSREIGDTRKSRLTLMHLAKLRKIREYRKYQNSKDRVKAARMYGTPEESSDDLGGL